MAGLSPLFWKLGAASLSLLAAIAVYVLLRAAPPVPLDAISLTLATHSGFAGSAPSLFYTLSLALFIGACAETSRAARLHCLSWVSLASMLEVLQFPALAEPLASWLESTLPGAAWKIAGPYWTRGTFDLLDLLATLCGGLIALFLLDRLSVDRKHEAVS